MIFRSKSLSWSSVVLAGCLMSVVSCKEEEPERITLQDTSDLSEEALTDAYFQDMDDIAAIAVEAPSETEYSNGRTSGSITIQDERFNCEGIVVTVEPDANSTAEIPSGVLTIDFGSSGCSDLKGNVRKGKLIFTYHGKRFMPGSTVVTTTNGYSVNGVTLEGVRTLTNLQNSTSDAPRFNVVLQNGKATFQDQRVATRESDVTWQWNREANPLEDNLQIEQSSTASGTTRGGRQYEVSLSQDLIYKRHCGIAVSGIKQYTLENGKLITINYGDGSCDQTFTVTVNGVTRDISLN